MTDLSSQSSCDCGARVGQNHSSDCQYVADVLAQEVEKATRKLSQ